MKKVWFILEVQGTGTENKEVALGKRRLVAATALGKDDLNDVLKTKKKKRYKDQRTPH